MGYPGKPFQNFLRGLRASASRPESGVLCKRVISPAKKIPASAPSPTGWGGARIRGSGGTLFARQPEAGFDPVNKYHRITGSQSSLKKFLFMPKHLGVPVSLTNVRPLPLLLSIKLIVSGKNMRKGALSLIELLLILVISSIISFSSVAADPNPFRAIDITRSNIPLTAVEKAWLQDHKTIRIAGPRSFPPFHYFDKEEVLKGISADYIYTMVKYLGLQVEVQRNLPWSEVLRMAQTGKIDLIPCIAKTAERESYLRFSTPYLSFPLVIISRKDAAFIGGIEDLYGKKLASIPKSSTVEWLQRDGIDFSPYYVESPLKALESVSFGHADARIENLAAASYLMQKNGLTNLKIAAPTPYGNYNLHMAVRTDLPILLGLINKAIDAIPPERHMEIRSKLLSVRYEYGISKTDVLEWVLAITFFSAGILIVVLIWNRKLKKEIFERKLAEEALKKSEERYRSLVTNIPDVVWTADAGGGIRYISPNIEKVYGYTPEEIYEEESRIRLGSIHPEDAGQVKKAFRELFEKGSIFDVEYRIRRKDGGWIWVNQRSIATYEENSVLCTDGILLNITDRKQAAEEREKLIHELQKALREIKTLRGILPLCSFCKKIRDDKGYWEKVDVYIHKYSQADISHSICPECAKKHYPDLKFHR